MKNYKFYVYKTTNNINGKIYVGVHRSTDIENDSYLGSGRTMIKAIKKYGEESFKREIIDSFDTSEEAFLLEKEIVDQEFVDRKDTYNLALGGKGFYFEKKEDHPMFGKTLSSDHRKIVSESMKTYYSNEDNLKEHSRKRKEWCSKEENKEILRENGRKVWRDPDFVQKRKDKMEELYSDPSYIKKLSDSAKERERKYGNGFAGKKHSEDTKKKMRKPRRRIICTHCGKEGAVGHMKRFHFDNCKFKKE